MPIILVPEKYALIYTLTEALWAAFRVPTTPFIKLEAFVISIVFAWRVREKYKYKHLIVSSMLCQLFCIENEDQIPRW